MQALILTVAFAFLETIIRLLSNAAMYISSMVLVPSLFEFEEGSDLFSELFSLLPLGDVLWDISAIIRVIALLIIGMSVFLIGIREVASPLLSKDEGMMKRFGRTVVTVILLIIIFGPKISAAQPNGLLKESGKLFSFILSSLDVKETISDMSLDLFDLTSIELNVLNYIGILIMLSTILMNVIGAAVSYLERIVIFVVSVLFGPVCIAFYVDKESEEIALSWILSIFTQFLSILLCLFLWKLFVLQIRVESKGSELFKYALSIGILSLISHAEKIFSTFGLKTMPNGDSAKMVARGFNTLIRGAGAMTRMTGGIRRGTAQKSASVTKAEKSSLAASPVKSDLGDRVKAQKIYQEKASSSIGRFKESSDKKKEAGSELARAQSAMNNASLLGGKEALQARDSYDAAKERFRIANNDYASSHTSALSDTSLNGVSPRGLMSDYGIDHKNFLVDESRTPRFIEDINGNDYIAISGFREDGEMVKMLIEEGENQGEVDPGDDLSFLFPDDEKKSQVDEVIKLDDGTRVLLIKEKKDETAFNEVKENLKEKGSDETS